MNNEQCSSEPLGVQPPHFPRRVIERRIPMRYGRLMAMGIVFVSSTFAPAALAQQNANRPQKWEYKVVNYCDPENQGINELEIIQYLGEEGWELVSADTRQVGETTRCPVHYFKRPGSVESKQITKRQPQCSVPLDRTPSIRGLRLGMSADELLSLLAFNNNRVKSDQENKQREFVF
jgi:Domain of unknown function (DUF4177)